MGIVLGKSVEGVAVWVVDVCSVTGIDGRSLMAKVSVDVGTRLGSSEDSSPIDGT